MGVSILSGPARCSPSGSTSARFRFRSFRNDSGLASLPSPASVWLMETKKLRMMKSATSVWNNIADGRTIFPSTVERGRTDLGFPEEGGDNNRLSYPQFPNFAGGHRPNPQSVLINTVPKDCKPNGVQRTKFGEHKRGNALDERGTDSKEHGNTTSSVSNILSPKEKLVQIFDKVLVVDNVLKAREVVGMITTKYRDLIFACDTEVAKIDVKQETPVGHGEVICFSIYCGSQADFGGGKTCIWVDVLDGGVNVLMEFAPFFEDPSIKKVWHNYSFDSHVIENYGIKLSGFHADTMHLARLWDSSRRADGGYSLEALTNDPNVIPTKNHLSSMTSILGRYH